ncbi:MAG: signal recognition particle-docking protein FtsY [Desulfobacterales bacterium]|nr:MAG: signal recognition particle-docking protein FtsY [Desulfobacterales bacterium]
MLGWFNKKKKSTSDSAQQQELQKTAPDSGETGAEKPASTEPVPEKAYVEAIPDKALHDDTCRHNTEPDSKPIDTHAEEDPSKEQDPGAGQVKKSKSILTKLSERLVRTRDSFTHRLDELFLGKKEIDADLFDSLEEILVTADLGIHTTRDLLEFARRRVKRDALSDPIALKELLKERITSIIVAHEQPAERAFPDNGPFVIMVVGVNGVGKTTTIGKITRKFLNSGQSVLLVAADTFRAAASSQLKIWGERNNVRVVAQHEGADPSSVVFDAMTTAVRKQYDIVLIDTAGRLHTKVNLMEELKKIKRVIGKQLDGAPHEILLVIDATTGQNGISQAKLFNEAVGITGIALTKLDGTAKGGIVANIAQELKTPIRFIGIGEQIDDLKDFDADEFVSALFEPRQ